MKYSQLKERIKILRRYSYRKFRGQEMYCRRFKREHKGEIYSVGHWLSITEITHMSIDDLAPLIIQEYGRALVALDSEIQKLK